MALPKSFRKLLVGRLGNAPPESGFEVGSIIRLVRLRVSLALAVREETEVAWRKLSFMPRDVLLVIDLKLRMWTVPAQCSFDCCWDSRLTQIYCSIFAR